LLEGVLVWEWRRPLLEPRRSVTIPQAFRHVSVIDQGEEQTETYRDTTAFVEMPKPGRE
jgi:hypothetical protein